MSDAAWSWKAGKGNNSGTDQTNVIRHTQGEIHPHMRSYIYYLECVQKYRVSYIGFNSF